MAARYSQEKAVSAYNRSNLQGSPEMSSQGDAKDGYNNNYFELENNQTHEPIYWPPLCYQGL